MENQRIEFFLDIEPESKLRARFDSVRRRTYTPAKTESYERALQFLARKHAPKQLLTCALSMKCLFLRTKPKSSKLEFPTSKPDTDNYFKAVADAFNGLFYIDDSQIVENYGVKRWATSKRGIWVRIEPFSETDFL